MYAVNVGKLIAAVLVVASFATAAAQITSSSNRVLNLAGGANDFVSLGRSLPDMTNLTIEVWVRNLDGTRPGVILMDATAAVGSDFLLDIGGSHVGVRADKNGASLGSVGSGSLDAAGGLIVPSLSLVGAWHHIAWVMTPTRSFVYLDGVLLGTIAKTGSNVGFHAARPRIGNWYDENANYPQPFTGQIDELRIWNDALSEITIRERRLSKLTGNESNLVGYWNFDDGTTRDISPSANHGTANGAVTTPFSPVVPVTTPFAPVVPVPTITTHPLSVTVTAGQVASFAASFVGLSPISYQWRRGSAVIAGATAASYTIASAQPSDAGSYSVTITNSGGSATSNAAVLTVRPANPGRLANLSIRTATTSGSGTLIVGFVIGGSGTSGPIPLLLRASGPALVPFGVIGPLQDPFLSLFDGGGKFIESNDNWGASVASIAAGVGAFTFPPESKDSALSTAATGSSYTAQIFGLNDGVGVTLAEVYDTNGSYSHSNRRLINLSARARVGTEGDVMIAGFVIKGSTPVAMLFRAVGPTLVQFGVSGVLANPRLTLYQEAALIATNDDWGEVGSATISLTAAAVGAFNLPVGSRDSALLITLQPGPYTAQVSGVGNTTGISLVEIYEVP